MKTPAAYRSLTALNRAVGQALKHLNRLQRLGLVSREFAESHRITAEKLRAEANRELTKILDPKATHEHRRKPKSQKSIARSRSATNING